MSYLAPSNTRWIICIDGTWGDRNLQGASTVVGDLGVLLKRRQHAIWYLEGLGTSTTIIDHVLGGFTGLGIHDQIQKAFRFLIENWNEGDEIVIIGYSRGAYAAVRLAELISSVGLPQENPKSSARELYKRFQNGDLDLADSRWRSIREFHCNENVPIKLLALFDMVSTLGIPKTGILRFLKWIPQPSSNKSVQVVHSLKKVENIFHALATHETRGPYVPTLVCLPEDSTTRLAQVWFNGSHRDLGKEHRHGGGLVDIPLAWMIDMLASVGVECDQTRLENRFPGYHRPDATGEGTSRLNEWARGQANHTYKGVMTFMGYEPRKPGRYAPPGTRTNEEIHISIRLRGYGTTKGSRPMPGLRYEQSLGESIKWTSCRNWSSEESNGSGTENRVVISEAPIGALEAALHNISLP